MKSVAAAIATMRAKGLSDSDILDVVEAMTGAEEDTRSPGAKRTARWRAKRDSVTSDVTVTSPKEMSPDPYKKTTPPEHPSDAQTPLGSQGDNQKPKKRGSRLPRDWRPSAELQSYAMEQGVPAEAVEREFEDWCAWAWSDSTPKSVKLDWDLAAKTAMRRAGDKHRAKAARDPPGRFDFNSRQPYRSPLD